MSIQFIRTTKEGQQTLPADYSDSFVFITDDNSREFTVGNKEYHCLTNEEREKFATFVTFEDVEKSEAVASAALNNLDQRILELDNKYGSITVPTNISELTNDAGYITSEAITGKQDNIVDLDTIRANAALGATALQTIPDEYVTETELEAKGYLTEHQDISSKAEASDLSSHTNNTEIHVTSADKTNWNSAKSAIDTFLADADMTTNAVDTLKELQSYMTSDGAAATELLNRVSALEAIDHNAYKSADATLKSEMESYANSLNTTMDSRVDALEAINHNAYVAADQQVLTDAKAYTDGLMTFATDADIDALFA